MRGLFWGVSGCGGYLGVFLGTGAVLGCFWVRGLFWGVSEGGGGFVVVLGAGAVLGCFGYSGREAAR